MEFRTNVDNIRAVQTVIDSATKFFGSPKDYLSATMTRPRTRAPRVRVLKKDIFSEVNGYVILEEPELAEQLTSYFDRLWRHDLSADVKILL